MEMDLELKSWLEFHNRRYQVIVTKIDKLKSNNQLKAGLAAIQKRIEGSGASAVLGHRRPGSEGNLANHLEDQEQAVAPAAATEGKPTEKPQDRNGANAQKYCRCTQLTNSPRAEAKPAVKTADAPKGTGAHQAAR